MNEHIEERRLKGIAKQIGLLKSEIHRTRRTGMMRFLLGLMLGLLANVVFELLKL